MLSKHLKRSNLIDLFSKLFANFNDENSTEFSLRIWLFNTVKYDLLLQLIKLTIVRNLLENIVFVKLKLGSLLTKIFSMRL
jgi:hypothetical protein